VNFNGSPLLNESYHIELRFHAWEVSLLQHERRCDWDIRKGANTVDSAPAMGLGLGVQYIMIASSFKEWLFPHCVVG
jgi:hypothetical protein